jgi:hypothetical protein
MRDLVQLKNYKNSFIQNTNEYILTHYIKDSGNRTSCIYFTMENCYGCEEINKLIEDKTIQENYEIVKVYDYNDMDNSHTRDIYGIYESIYNIVIYPSFLIIDKESNSVRITNELPLN